jgi:hypothetical protein
MPAYRVLNTTDVDEIIIKNELDGKELALKIGRSNKCEYCFYPFSNKAKKDCHVGLKSWENHSSYLFGSYYETDYQGHPNDWFGELYKQISEEPFRHSHELIKLVLICRIINAAWDLSNISFATMVPTSNLQMKDIFSEISKELEIKWIDDKEIFVTNPLNQAFKKRDDYVRKKYDLVNDLPSLIINEEDRKTVLIFDDVLHEGYTFARILELLKGLDYHYYYLITICRTTPQTIFKGNYFPK